MPNALASKIASPARPADVAEVERTTGIPRATLRIWERRYGFPKPQRDARGERLYDPAQVARLRMIGTLVARGHRPGGLVTLPPDALQALAEASADGAGRFGHVPLVQLARELDSSALTGWLLEQLAVLGIERFLLETVPESITLVGDAWACGELHVHDEHLYTECMQQVLRTVLASLPPPPKGARPRVLLATLPHEQHGLGLLAAQALLSLGGCACLPLGLALPAAQVAAAASVWRADVVALSFSRAYSARELLAGLAELQPLLPGDTQLWVGGKCAALGRPEVAEMPRLRRFRELDELKPALASLRGPG